MSAIDEVVDAFKGAGWTVLVRTAVAAGHSGPNPTRLDIARGTVRLPLLVYAWKGTHEGRGRTGPNYRVQTTRIHEGPLMIEPDRLTVGFGIDPARNVIFIFDGWTKRYTGSSSSVHIKRATLEAAAADGYAEQGPEHDARAAAAPDRMTNLLEWALKQRGERQAVVRSLSYQISSTGLEAEVTADMWSGSASKWLRPGDKLVIANAQASRLLDRGVWQIDDLNVNQLPATSGYPRYHISFTCTRVGRVESPISILHTWPGGLR